MWGKHLSSPFPRLFITQSTSCPPFYIIAFKLSPFMRQPVTQWALWWGGSSFSLQSLAFSLLLLCSTALGHWAVLFLFIISASLCFLNFLLLLSPLPLSLCGIFCPFLHMHPKMPPPWLWGSAVPCSGWVGCGWNRLCLARGSPSLSSQGLADPTVKPRDTCPVELQKEEL